MRPGPIRHVYIMASLSRTLYIGITRDLPRRVHEHKTGALPEFTRDYAVTRLVHYESTDHIRSAITRERQI
jgi:putative endonuclease